MSDQPLLLFVLLSRDFLLFFLLCLAVHGSASGSYLYSGSGFGQHSDFERELIRGLQAVSQIDVKGVSNNPDTAIRDLKNGKFTTLITIPNGFMKRRHYRRPYGPGISF